MAKASSKARVQELASNLQKSIAAEAAWAKEIVALLLEDTKNNLVTAQGDDMLRKQGEAQLLQRLHTDLTRPSPVTREQ